MLDRRTLLKRGAGITLAVPLSAVAARLPMSDTAVAYDLLEVSDDWARQFLVDAMATDPVLAAVLEDSGLAHDGEIIL